MAERFWTSQEDPKMIFFWNLQAEGIGLPDTDERIKEIGQNDRPKDFVETVLVQHACLCVVLFNSKLAG